MQKRYRWVKVEDNIVVALRFGGDLSANPDNLLNNPNLLKVPFIENVNGKMMASYTISNQPMDSNFSPMRNTICKLEIELE